MALEIKASTECPDVTLVIPAGRMDALTADEISAALTRVIGESKAGILVDLTNVPYVSSAGVRALIMAGKTATAAGKPLAVFHLHPAVYKLFKLAALDTMVCLCEEEADALKAIGK